MSAANLPEEIRYCVYSEAFKSVTLLDGLVPIEIDGKVATRYEQWSGKVPTFAKYLRTWGEAGKVMVKVGSTVSKIFKNACFRST
jgi:hypothetical protein